MNGSSGIKLYTLGVFWLSAAAIGASCHAQTPQSAQTALRLPVFDIASVKPVGHPSQATNDEVHLLQSTRFLSGTAPLVSAINEGQIANALTDSRPLPGKSASVDRFIKRTPKLPRSRILGNELRIADELSRQH
jgi:hypothetical protein